MYISYRQIKRCAEIAKMQKMNISKHTRNKYIRDVSLSFRIGMFILVINGIATISEKVCQTTKPRTRIWKLIQNSV